ncbi:MAG TPA: hypothetical protein VF809_00425 [Candidatus Saccharimonadales bacterium]
MEQNPFRQTEDAGDGSSSNGKKSDGFSYAPNQRPDMAPRPERPIARAPIEGIISWRVPGEDIFRQSPETDTPESSDSDKGGKDGDKKSAKSTNKPIAQRPQARRSSEIPLIAETELASPEEIPDDDDEEYEDVPEIFDDIRINPDFQLEPTVDPNPADVPVYEAPSINTHNIQHPHEQDNDDQIVGRPLIAAGGGTQPPLPPSSSHQPVAYNQAPQPSQYYVNQYMQPGEYSGQPNVAPRSPDLAPAMPIEHPRHTTNYDPRLAPVAATLGLGLLAEHIGRRRGDRRVEKQMSERMDRQAAKQEDIYTSSQRTLQERQHQFAAEQERQAAEMQHMHKAQERLVVPPPPLPEHYKPAATSGEVTSHGSNERPRQYVEQRPAQALAQEAVPDIQAIEQSVEARPRQHVEHSSWHNIVVDNRGHEVAGAIQYGEGFKQERQPEAMQNSGSGSGSGSNSGVTAGSSSVQHQQRHFGGPVYPGALPSGMTTPTLPQGQPTHIDPQHQLQASRAQQSNVSNPWFWVMLALVIAAFFTAMFI